MIDVEQYVVKEDESATHRKVIIPPNDQIAELLVQMYEDCAEAKFTGKWTVNFQTGGVPNIITEHTISGLEGLFDDDEDEGDEDENDIEENELEEPDPESEGEPV